MDNARTGHSRLGITSLVLALVPVLVFIIAIPLIWIYTNSLPPGADTVAVGFGVLVLMLMSAISEITAASLGVIGALQRRRKRLFAFLRIASCILVLMFGYVQDVILPAWM